MKKVVTWRICMSFRVWSTTCIYVPWLPASLLYCYHRFNIKRFTEAFDGKWRWDFDDWPIAEKRHSICWTRTTSVRVPTSHIASKYIKVLKNFSEIHHAVLERLWIRWWLKNMTTLLYETNLVFDPGSQIPFQKINYWSSKT